MDIGEDAKLRILELCKENNITVNKLSIICGMTQSTLNNIVSGRNKSLTLSKVKKFVMDLKLECRISSPRHFLKI